MEYPQKQEIIKNTDKDFLKAAEELFTEAMQNKNLGQFKEKVYRKVDKTEAAKIKEKTGLDIEGFAHKITNTDLRHIFLEHGNPKTETPRGQIAVTKDDIKLIPEITKSYDSVELLKKKSENKPTLAYTKTIEDKYYYLESVGGKKKRDLRPKSMRITKNKQR